jgi:hypothetical protein
MYDTTQDGLLLLNVIPKPDFVDTMKESIPLNTTVLQLYSKMAFCSKW